MAAVRLNDYSAELLRVLTQETGKTQQQVVESALENYRRELFFEDLTAGYAALRNDPNAWAGRKREHDELDGTLADMPA